MKIQNAESVTVEKEKGLWVKEIKNYFAGFEISKYTLISSVLIFFISRAYLPNGIIPFGTAAFAAIVSSSRHRLNPLTSFLYGILVLIGTATLGQVWQLFIAIFTMLLYHVLMHFDDRISSECAEAELSEKDHRMPVAIKSGLMLLLAGSVPSIIALSVKGALLADIFALTLQLIITFVVFYVFRNSVKVLQDDVSRKLMTNEEMACIAITLAIAAMGIWDFIIIGLSLRRVFCIIIIMIFSYRGGLGTGAACGVVVGILLTSSTMANGGELSATVISIYAFCGFLSGLFNRYKKLGVSLGFFLGNFMLAILLTANADIIINIYEIFLSIIVFIILPNKFTEFLKLPQLTGVKIPSVRVNYAEKLKQAASNKLNGFADILQEMSNICKDITNQSLENNQNDIVQIVDRTSERVCSRCAMCTECWERSFYLTYQSFSTIAETLEKQGRILPEEVPKNLVIRCPNINSVIYEAKSAFEIWRLERLWRKRVEECKQVLPSQLNNMSEILTSLANEVDLSVNFSESMEKDIIKEFALNDKRVKNVTVSRNKYGRYEVIADVKCCSSKKQCIYSYLNIISKVLKVPMSLETTTCQNSGSNLWCSLVFTEEEPFKISVKASSESATGSIVSGDSFAFVELDKGIYMICLSDGMGSGEIARKQSDSVVKLIQLFMESGLSFSAAISMIDSLLETGVDKVMSATVDLCIIDLFKGNASFLKLGAVPSIIKKKEKVETVVISSLPMGFVSGESSEYKTVTRRLESGDYVILCSDGVIEAFRNAQFSDIEFYAYIESIKAANPQNISDLIIEKACGLYDGKPKDDITVIVAKVWQKTL